MRGKVLSYNGSTGVISGDDGRRYTFSAADLGDGVSYVPAGSAVDFEVVGDTATSIYVIVTALGEKNKWIAALLCFFFGWFGVHKFYLGKTNAGIIMALCGTIGWIVVIPGLVVAFISFIELIIYLVKSDQSFYEDYVAGNRSWF
ncbi:TM2 domain protein [Asticcacaulis biprosthecium C19]|uniref:TM2 domain protein n=1 Tax=Asticcacaulis biprosthecium C19 TaxID=715226 RepID=F4QQX2_9CAUL|nr:TM2 domain-containing protein [Asticcacaulis biprosthecium]EGF90609.1 TM2 domain protein [Asticcacaulis biprosthecium C19]